MKQRTIVLFLGLAGCMKHASEAYPSYADDYARAAPAPAEDYGGAYPEEMSRSASPAPSAKAPQASGTTSPTTSTAPTPAAARKVHYAGSATLRVDNLEESAKSLTALVMAKGGRLESQSGWTLTFRVPVDQFQTIFSELLTQGEVVTRALTAQDITESFSATDLRLKSLKATRDRLIELLAKAKTEDEKIALVQEIQSVTEEIDALEAQLRLLSSLANESRITLNLQERAPMVAQDSQGSMVFSWIASLSPFNQTLSHTGGPINQPVPEGMVQLTKKPFSAEGADGARMMVTRTPNEPRGDADFWIAAIEERLKTGYSEVSEKKIGGVTFIRVQGPGNEAERYRYLVGVRVTGKHLEIIELYFPSAASEDRYAAALNAVLAVEGS